jgi:hypothetical protein
VLTGREPHNSHESNETLQSNRCHCCCYYLLYWHPNPAAAGLGAVSSSASTSFDAWCGSKGNKCKVKFADEPITVSGSDSISFDQVIGYTTAQNWRYHIGGSYWLHIITIQYDEDGNTKSGKLLFSNSTVATDFATKASMACRQCRPVGSSIKIEQ